MEDIGVSIEDEYIGCYKRSAGNSNIIYHHRERVDRFLLTYWQQMWHFCCFFPWENVQTDACLITFYSYSKDDINRIIWVVF